MNPEDLKKILKEGKLIYGTSKTMKLLKTGKISQIFISSNCPSRIKDEIKKLSQVSSVKVTELKETNQELGTICKKTFSISVACY